MRQKDEKPDTLHKARLLLSKGITPVRILSLCTSAGLWDRAWLDAGHEVVAGCEIMPHKRAMYEAFCEDTHLCHDLADLPTFVAGERFDGIIGGIPCQSFSRTRAMRKPKFGDLTGMVITVLECCSWDWFLFENVRPLKIPGAVHSLVDAMHYAKPHQSRPRYFTHSPSMTPPEPLFQGDLNELMAYPCVAARLYGPKRSAVLQGWPQFAQLEGFGCLQLQEALADGVHRGVAEAWIKAIEKERVRS